MRTPSLSPLRRGDHLAAAVSATPAAADPGTLRVVAGVGGADGGGLPNAAGSVATNLRGPRADPGVFCWRVAFPVGTCSCWCCSQCYWSWCSTLVLRVRLRAGMGQRPGSADAYSPRKTGGGRGRGRCCGGRVRSDRWLLGSATRGSCLPPHRGAAGHVRRVAADPPRLGRRRRLACSGIGRGDRATARGRPHRGHRAPGTTGRFANAGALQGS